jgi:hypothetical protein
MLKKILIGIVVLLVGVLGFAATRPDSFRIVRTTKISAPAEIVFGQLTDFHKWGAWSPWEKLDPALKKTYSGTENAVGHGYAWEGNKDVGKGKMSITELAAPKSLKIKLEFLEPMAATNDTIFTLKAAGEGAEVEWAMEGKNNFVSKLFGLFMNIDEMVGKDFENGLVALKKVSEDTAIAAAAAAKKKAEEEATAAAAAAAAAASAPPSDGAAPVSAPASAP